MFCSLFSSFKSNLPSGCENYHWGNNISFLRNSGQDYPRSETQFALVWFNLSSDLIFNI